MSDISVKSANIYMNIMIGVALLILVTCQTPFWGKDRGEESRNEYPSLNVRLLLDQ